MNSEVRKPVLKASEVAQYCYCSVAWHLQRQGYKPDSPALEAGAEKHRDLGGQIDTISKHEKHASRFKWTVISLSVIGLGTAVYLFLLMGIGAVSVVIYIIIFLCIIGIVIMSFSRREYKRAKRLKDEHGIPEGRIVYTDLDKPAEPLFSRKYWITGKPDYIVKAGHEHIPVEVKSTISDEPYRGHVMQLALYCLLLKARYRRTTPFGIIVYGDGRQFKIPFTDKLQQELIDTLDQMRMLLRTKTFQRNHTSSAKCEACSFRKHCKQIIE